MAFKYFFIFEDFFKGITFDFSQCDCPLDSVILSKLKYHGTPWTRIGKEEYISVQNKIKTDSQFGRLKFDLENW